MAFLYLTTLDILIYNVNPSSVLGFISFKQDLWILGNWNTLGNNAGLTLRTGTIASSGVICKPFSKSSKPESV